ncbi:MAG: glycosyltransferase family 4 protein, partial [Candidatus Eremiobacterota bacterium]
MDRQKIAFIVQRCGREVNGGAEAHCLTMAGKMKELWDVEILTTCAVDYITWADYYPEGVELIDGVPVRRFQVDTQRVKEKFDSYSEYIRRNITTVTGEECEKWMNLQGPVSTGLLNYIKASRDNYDRFIFFTYLYCSTYYSLPLVAEKACLVPTAHDEWPIYLPIWDEFFKKPRDFIFNTVEEKIFLEKRFPGITFKGEIAGVGVDLPDDISEQRFRDLYHVDSPYMLYIGRIEESKGCKDLFDYFIRYKKEEACDIKLVLAGKPVMDVPESPDIITPGFIDEQTKFDAIKGCEFLINPSPHESLSIVLLEAWSLNRPVLVTEKCNVLIEQCRRSNGGLWYRDYDEFKACVEYLLKNKNIASNSEKFVQEHYSWEKIKNKYEETIKNTEKNSSSEVAEEQTGETLKKKINLSGYIAGMFPYITAIILCSLTVFFVMNLGRADMNIPFMYDGDGLNAQAVIFKGIVDHGWYVTNNSLGAPYGSKEYDFMVCQNLNLHCFFIKIFSFFSKSYGFIMNMYFLIAFIFITVTSLYVFLRFKISAPVAVTASLLFTFLPYHFFRGEGHFFLGTYYMIPLTVMLVLKLYESPVILYRENYKKIAICVIICIL